jgi:hypothetical protein
MLPNFLGIGAPKAGTTWLARCLAEHPQVFMAEMKEVCFLDHGSIEGRLHEYEAHFADAEGKAAVGEFTTRYLASDRPPARIKALLPGVRLIASLRNPIDQVYSHYWHLLRQNFHGWCGDDLPKTFEQALDRLGDRLTAQALYHDHLRRWLTFFDRDQLLICFYDDIAARPDRVVREVYSFLGVDPDFVPASLRERSSDTRRGVSPRNEFLGRFYSRVYDGLNRRVYRPLKSRLGVARASRVKDALRARQVMELLFFRKAYPSMDPRTRAALAERFRDDIAGLEDLTGRDLRHWK